MKHKIVSIKNINKPLVPKSLQKVRKKWEHRMPNCLSSDTPYKSWIVINNNNSKRGIFIQGKTLSKLRVLLSIRALFERRRNVTHQKYIIQSKSLKMSFNISS